MSTDEGVERPGEGVERLRHNPRNAVTRTVERVRRADGSTFVRKVLQPSDPGSPDFWQGSEDPRHWNYWRREVEAYRSESLRASLAGTGLELAGAAVEEHPDDGFVVLELEDVGGRSGGELDLDDHAAVARGLGLWHARPPLDLPWLSWRFLREYSASKPARFELLEDDRLWEHRLIVEHWPSGIRDGWRRLVANRERLHAVMEALPRVTAHLDLWPSNEIRRPSGEVVLLDWAFSGDGAVGEDLGNHVPDGAFDLFWPSARLPELDEAVFDAYMAGLREGGSQLDERVVRLGVTGACVKYAWLVPLILGDLDAPQRAYHEPVDADHLFDERGRALQFLLGWCDEALALSDGLGL